MITSGTVTDKWEILVADRSSKNYKFLYTKLLLAMN